MSTLTEIEKETKALSDIRQQLIERKRSYDLGIQAVRKQHYPGLRAAGKRLAEKVSGIKDMIDISRELFKSPRTVTFWGIRVGIKKEKGKLEISNEKSTIKLIKKHYPDTWETYIKTEEKPVKKALETLPAAELKKLGINVTKDTDAVFIKSQDSEIDKFMDALLKEDEAEEMKEAV